MKEDKQFLWHSFKTVPVIGIIRNMDAVLVEELAPLCRDTGLTTLEITMNTRLAPQMIKSLRRQYPGMNIGAGTVLKMDELEQALDAGATFIVTPVLNEDVISFCARNEIPVFPGAFTPSEIYRAWEAGAAAVKVFPASVAGPAYLKEVGAPLRQVRLLPTGGVTVENMESYFMAGAAGVGMGSALFRKDLIANKDLSRLKQHFEQVVSAVKRCSHATAW